jgi:transposase-like protein
MIGDSVMEKKIKHFTAEEKKEVLEKLTKGISAKAELAQSLGTTVGTICRWIREAREGQLDQAVEKAPRVDRLGVDPKYVRQLEEKLREANEKLGELYIVVEGIKKVRDDMSMRNASSFVVTGQNLGRFKRRVK